MAEEKHDLAWSLKKIKEAFAQRPLTAAEHASALVEMTGALALAVKKVFYEKSRTKFSADPVVQKKTLVSFMGRMRVDALEKFNQTTVLSVIHYFLDRRQLQAFRPAGVLIVYLKRDDAPEMLRLLQYPYIDADDDHEVLDGAGAIANLIAGHFKNELIVLGYPDLQMSHFQSFINKAPLGVDFPQKETERYTLLFPVDDKKRLVVEMVMAPIPRKIP